MVALTKCELKGTVAGVAASFKRLTLERGRKLLRSFYPGSLTMATQSEPVVLIYFQWSSGTLERASALIEKLTIAASAFTRPKLFHWMLMMAMSLACEASATSKLVKVSIASQITRGVVNSGRWIGNHSQNAFLICRTRSVRILKALYRT